MKTIFDIIARDNASGAFYKVENSMRRVGKAQKEITRLNVQQGWASKAAAGVGGFFSGGLGKEFEKMAVGGGIMVAGGGIVGGLKAAEKLAGQFAYQIAGLGAVSGATAQELKAMETSAKKAGIATQYTPTEAAQALQTLAQAGFNAQQSINLLNPALDLAASSAGQLTVEMGAGVMTQAIRGFGVEAKDASLAVDQMLKAVQAFSIDAADLPLGLSNVSRGAQRMGQNISESMITFGLVRNVISRVETAATATGVAMERLANKDVMAKIKSEMGVDVAVNGKFRSYLDVIADMLPKLQKMSEVKRANFFEQTFGSEGSRGIQAIYAQLTNGVQTVTGQTVKGADAIKYYREQMAGAGGTAASFREALLESSEGQKILWKGSVETAKISTGQVVSSIIKPLFKGALGTLNSFIEAFEVLPPIAQKITVGFAGVAGVFMKTLGAVILLGGAMKMLGITFKGLLFTVGKTLLVAVPLLGVLGALGVGFYGMHRAAEKNIGGTGGMFSGLWSKIKLGFRGTLDLISGGGLSEAVKKDLQKSENTGVAKFLVWVTGAIGRAKAFFGGMVAGFDAGLAKLDGPFGRFKSTLMGIFGFSDTSDPAKTMQEWGKAGESLGGKLADLSAKIIDLADRGVKSLSQAFKGFSLEDVSGALQGIITLFETMAKLIDRISDGIGIVVDAWTALKAGNRTGGDIKKMTTDEMLAATRAKKGRESRDEMQAMFSAIDKMVERGERTAMGGRVLKESAFIQGQFAPESKSFSQLKGMAAPDHGIVATLLANKKEDPAMVSAAKSIASSVDKMATMGFSFMIDQDKVGEIVRGVGQRDQERDYNETSPAPAGG
ncbi:MAG: phage tail tape measure protein [Acidobacteriia bacterium]|nr:phage tail tape measure protein [Terriglobia bacterium]